MKQEEFYIWLVNCNSGTFYEFNPEFLNNYEISKLLLEKISINYLSENQQKSLNPEAVSVWFRISEYIYLEYDIPEILELLPKRIRGNLNLRGSQVQSLPKLESVEGWLYLENSQVQSLPELESVGGHLYLRNSQIESLPKLESVGGDLNLKNSKIQSLPKLKSTGDKIYVSLDGESYWKNYFRETGRTYLVEKLNI